MILQTATSTSGLYEGVAVLDLLLAMFIGTFLFAGVIRIYQKWFRPEL